MSQPAARAPASSRALADSHDQPALGHRARARLGPGFLLALALACLAACRHEPPRPPAAGAASGIRRTVIGRTPAHEPGWETRLYLIEYPPGAAAPPHLHPVVGVGWVLEGEFESAFGDDAVTRVKAGQSFTDEAGPVHRVFRNVSTQAPLRFVIAYTIRTEDENLRPVP